MIDTILGRIFISQWLVIAVVSAVLLRCAELGLRFGWRRHHTKDAPRKGQIGGTQGAVLGTLALLFGFTFAMAAGRYETRRGPVLEEANAIGTTYDGIGASGARSAFTNVMLPLLIAVAITLIADLDRPRGGLIGISQQPLLDLKQSIQQNQP